MKKSLSILFLVILSPMALGGEPLTLLNCYERALRHHEAVAIQEEEIRAAEGRYYQALGGALPHLTVIGSEFLQDTSGVASGDGEIGQTFVRKSRPEVAINLKQPLFQGLREFRAIRGASADRKKTSHETTRAAQLLFSEVARAFLDVKHLESRTTITVSQKTVMQKRVAELREWSRLGKSRKSEVFATEAELAQTEAAVEGEKGQWAVARETFSFLTGIPPETPLSNIEDERQSLKSLEEYLGAAEGRPDVLAAGENEKLTKAKLEYFKGGRLPHLDLEGNYYPYRVGFQQEIDWDLLLTLNIPIFQGGAVRGEIREARARLKQAELGRSETRRRSELEIRSAYQELASSQKKERALKRASEKARETYEALVDEHRHGLADNLDVLQSARIWHEARLASNEVHYQRRMNEVLFRLAIGDLP